MDVCPARPYTGEVRKVLGVLDPFGFLLIAVSGWMNQTQVQMIEYLREENRVLREQLGSRRLRFNNDQRRRLAEGERLGTETAGRGGHARHAGDVAGLASQTDRTEI